MDETTSPDQRVIDLTPEQYEAFARAMQWPEDVAQWDRDHDRTPTNMAVILGDMAII